jgi:protein TonB
MLDGFQPGAPALFVPRRRIPSTVLAALLVGGPLYWAFTFEPEPEPTPVEFEPELEDFSVEEKPEPQEEPSPPPPPDTKVEVVDKPAVRPKIQTPDKKVIEAADESDNDKVVEVPRGSTNSGGTGDRPVQRAERAKPPAPKPPKPVPEPRRKADAIDPTKPIDRPEDATAPEPESGNTQPEYPADLRDEGITGRVVIKLHVHRDGTVRGAKILSKKNNATSQQDQERANKLLLAAVIKVVKGWKYKPATLGGKPISVWHTVTIPFNLTAG